MHARKTARDALFPKPADDAFFAPRRGDITFRDAASVRAFADRLNRGEGRTEATKLTPSELGAMAFLHEVLHAVIQRYREAHPEAFEELSRALDDVLGEDKDAVVREFVTRFPPVPVYRHFRGEEEYVDLTPRRYLELAEPPFHAELHEEILLLWITNRNPAYERVRTVVGDDELGARYQVFVEEVRRFFAEAAPFGPRGESLFDLLLGPAKRGGTILEQMEYVEQSFGPELGVDALPFWEDKQKVHDLAHEESKWFQRGGPGPGEPLLEAMRFAPRDEDLPAQFSADLNWMPNVVLVAKSVYVWLFQLSVKYGREITRLDQIPDEELDFLRSCKFTGLWLIGLFERSHASRKIKQMRGDRDALASAYSLGGYDIAHELGGYPAWQNLRDRAWRRGIRLAADMVPNHVGIDGDWVIQHPDWFIQAKHPPYPNYRFHGPDLSSNPHVSVFLEEGYWNMTDAAVVYRRHDNHTGEDRFIYHGNDGTSMPWNDTAQLDYAKAEVRRAVIETILHVARMFPIIRFDAAMTLAKRHVQRLWYPLPGNSAEAIPSRGDYALTQEQFDAAIPVEFWREVVDVVAERAPDTLLLAEAFWMMEGYFVRTLGMHRVYNSAFMNMMKREENAKYKETITNVLDFDAEILKRFVNFMNNPDEETAIAQFGANEKYFGVCAMMATMPGLPMFGHGQVEGLQEKYGMEYRRPRSGEGPNPYVIARHEREIFPILAKRYLFSGVEHFALFDFFSDGHVDPDVFAYANGAGSERALVLFHNRYKTTRGRIHPSTHRGTLGEALALDEDRGWWLVYRDVPHGLEYVRPVKDVIDGGMAWELDGYAYHVLMDFRQVHATLEKPYDRLAMELAGRGVPDVEFALRELYLRPVHAPLREACSKGHLAYLTAQLEESDDIAARAALAERMGHVVDGLDWMLTQRSFRDVTVFREPAIERAGDRFTALHGFVRIARVDAASAEQVTSEPEPVVTAVDDPAAAEVEAAPAATPETIERELHLDLLIASLQLEATIEILAAGADALEIARAKPPEYLTAGAIVFRPEPRRWSQPSFPAPAEAAEPDLSLGAVAEVRAPQPLEDASEPPVEQLPVTPEPTEETADEPVAAPASEATITAQWAGLSWATRESLIEEWVLATPILEAFATAYDDAEAKHRAALVMLAATLPAGLLTPAVRLAIGTRRGQAFMDVHESDGVYWLNKERYEELVRFLAERESASGRLHIADAATEADGLIVIATEEGYRAQRIANRLGPPPNVDIPERRTQRPPSVAPKEEAPEGEAPADRDQEGGAEQDPDDA